MRGFSVLLQGHCGVTAGLFISTEVSESSMSVITFHSELKPHMITGSTWGRCRMEILRSQTCFQEMSSWLFFPAGVLAFFETRQNICFMRITKLSHNKGAELKQWIWGWTSDFSAAAVNRVFTSMLDEERRTFLPSFRTMQQDNLIFSFYFHCLILFSVTASLNVLILVPVSPVKHFVTLFRKKVLY